MAPRYTSCGNICTEKLLSAASGGLPAQLGLNSAQILLDNGITHTRYA
jgi:hypothetical protein